MEETLKANKIDYEYELGDINPSQFPKNSIPIYKLHGSCDFHPNPKNFDINIANISPTVQFDCPLSIMDLVDAPRYYRNWDRIPYPLMSLYATGKEVGSMRKPIERMREKWGKIIHKATHIVIIGIRYVEHDTHIWNPIFSSKAKIIFYTSEENLKKFYQRRKKKVVHVDERFEQSCESFMNHL